MAPNLKQSSFAGGELAPELYGRTDLGRYHSSARLLRNFIVTPSGGATNRPGLQFVREVKDSTKATRLIPFIFNESQAYAIEVGDFYMRFHTLGGTIFPEVPFESRIHTTPSPSDDLVHTGTAFVIDEHVGSRIQNTTDGSEGTVLSNGTNDVQANMTGGTNNDWRTGDVGVIIAPYEIATPWSEDEVFALRFAQINDVMTIVHPDHKPMELRRSADTSWEIETISVTSPVEPPTSLAQTSTLETSSGPRRWEWVVTSVDADGNESLPTAPEIEANVTLSSSTVKAVLNWTAPTVGTPAVRYNVYRGNRGIWGYVGSSTTSGTAAFTDPGSIPDYSDTPPVERDPFIFEPAGGPGTPRSIGFSGTNATKATVPEAWDDVYTVKYQVDVVKAPNIDTVEISVDPDGVSGFTLIETRQYVGTLNDRVVHVTYQLNYDGLDDNGIIKVEHTGGSGSVTGQSVTWNETAPTDAEVTYPRDVCFFEQRQVFGGFTRDPSLIETSRTAQLTNFDRAEPARDSDGLTFSLASLTLDAIKAVVPLGALLIFTEGRVWVVRGGQGYPLTPSSFDFKPRLEFSSGDVKPLVIGNSVIFMSSKSRVVREFQFDPEGRTSPRSSDRELSILARHLFRSYDVIEWQYADTPNNVVWAVRADGALIALTYVQEHEVWGWTRHDTGPSAAWDATTGLLSGHDSFKSVCAIPEVDEDKVYVIVERTVDSEVKKYVEVFADRRFEETEDSIFLDSALTYNGVNTSATTLTITELEGGWEGGKVFTLTASAPTFLARETSISAFDLTGTDGSTVRMTVQAFGSTTSLQVLAQADVPATLQGAPGTAVWSKALKSFDGLTHLKNTTVGALMDGAVQDGGVVGATGVLTFASTYAARATVGLKYFSDLETLPLDDPKQPQLTRAARKTATRIGIELAEWRGLWVGQDLTNLVELTSRHVDDNFETIDPKSKMVYVPIYNRYDRTLIVSMQQRDPLPVTILSVLPELDVGGQ